ncbi:MAG TPA: nickel-responsive transcriptional regulator NikR [Synergistaceae bacterium]|nr:nickel-responsive transcriptional regulator NikR [Synergistaceae bacterium]HQH77925.1 nickel-responsive transcriptional regulator NikR [Synergistaceae bacterium]
MESVVRFSVSMGQSLLDELDEWIVRKGIPNRSEALRQLVRTFVADSRWEEGHGDVCGSITVTYAHMAHDACTELTHVQHHFGDVILCASHAHMDEDHCLEVILVRGGVGRVRRLVEGVSGIKGLRSVQPCLTSLV